MQAALPRPDPAQPRAPATRQRRRLTTSYAYDANDQVVSQTQAGATTTFAYDAAGNLTSRALVGGSPTVFAYDAANRQVGFTPAGGDAVSFTLDALGRNWQRSVAGVLDATYSYLGDSNQVARISSGAQAIDGAFDPTGTRLATAVAGGAAGWLLADLHGNAAATAASDFSAFGSAFRYDPYGQLIDSVVGSTPAPWRFGGRLALDPDGATELYDWDARSYDPGLGAFTSLDTVTGSIESPLTLNRYLFTHANPTSLIDPDGHAVYNVDGAGISAYYRRGVRRAAAANLRAFRETDNNAAWSARFKANRRHWSYPLQIAGVVGAGLAGASAAPRVGAAATSWVIDTVALTTVATRSAGLAGAAGAACSRMCNGVMNLGEGAANAPSSSVTGAVSGTRGTPRLRSLGAASVDDFGTQDGSNLGDLLAGEVDRIQAVVDEAGRPLAVVGSAARGTRRGVGTSLPVGKGPRTRSDIDYLVPHGSVPYFGDSLQHLPSIDPRTGEILGVHNPFMGPAIRFEPGVSPYFVAGVE